LPSLREGRILKSMGRIAIVLLVAAGCGTNTLSLPARDGAPVDAAVALDGGGKDLSAQLPDLSAWLPAAADLAGYDFGVDALLPTCPGCPPCRSGSDCAAGNLCLAPGETIYCPLGDAGSGCNLQTDCNQDAGERCDLPSSLCWWVKYRFCQPPFCRTTTDCPPWARNCFNGSCFDSQCGPGPNYECPAYATCWGPGAELSSCGPEVCQTDSDCKTAPGYCVNGGCYPTLGACVPSPKP
jgi:hypothetical protein